MKVKKNWGTGGQVRVDVNEELKFCIIILFVCFICLFVVFFLGGGGGVRLNVNEDLKIL